MELKNKKLLKYRATPRLGNLSDGQKRAQSVYLNQINLDQHMSDAFEQGIGSFFNSKGDYKFTINRKDSGDFFTVVNKIQNDKGLKLYDIAAQTGVSVKTLYNLQKHHNNPSEGHTTTINVINKVLKKFPAYRTEWEVIRNTTPQEKVKEVVKKAAFDLSIYRTISVLGNFEGSYGIPLVTSLDLGQAAVTVFPKAMLPIFKKEDPLYAINWQSSTYEGLAYVGGYGKKFSGFNTIYMASFDNWNIIKFKKGKGRSGNLFGSLHKTNKKNIVDIKYYHDNKDSSLVSEDYLYDRNVKVTDIEYALPYVMSVGKNFVDAWAQQLLENNPQPPIDATETEK